MDRSEVKQWPFVYFSRGDASKSLNPCTYNTATMTCFHLSNLRHEWLRSMNRFSFELNIARLQHDTLPSTQNSYLNEWLQSPYITLPQWSYQYSINRQTLSELAFQRRMLCLLIADGLIVALHIFKSNHIDLILCYTLYFKRDDSRAFILRRQQRYSCFDKSIAYSYETESFHYLDLFWKSLPFFVGRLRC